MRYRPPSSRLLLVFAIAAVFACSTPRVETRAHPEADFTTYSTVHVLSPPEPGPTAAGYSAEIAAKMEEQTRRRVARRGFEIASTGSADLQLEIGVRTEQASRRVWASDPDANYYVNQEVQEAVVTIDLIDPVRGRQVWRGEARSRLPERDLIVGQSPETIWMNTLDEVLQRLPKE